jgi:hypothetical protein
VNFRSAAAVAKALLKVEAVDKARARRAAAKARNTMSPPKLGPSSRISVGQLIALDRERRADIPVTLPPVTILESPITDADLDLPDDPIAQERAERFLAAAYAYQRRQAEKAKPAQVVNIEVDDAALHLDHVDLKRIGEELQRIATRPPAKWRNPYPLNG